jgi:hypothetical protein
MVQPARTPIDPNLRDFYLEQYRQALENFRHWDQMAWTMMGLVSAAALGVLAWVFQGDNIHGAKLLWLGIASIVTVWSFRLMFCGMSSKQNALARPAVERFEDLFGSEQHLQKNPIPEGSLTASTVACVAFGQTSGYWL